MDDEHELTDRRGLLRGIAARVARGAKELAPAVSAVPRVEDALWPTSGSEASAAPDPPKRAALLPPELPDRAVTVDEVLQLAREHGLAARVDAVQSLCRTSVRFAAAPPDAVARSHAGGAPTLPGGFAASAWRDEPRPLPLIVRIDLAEIATAADFVPLPAAGTLWTFFDRSAPPGLNADDSGACRVIVEESSPERVSDTWPIAMARELVLPRVWSERVASLELSADEQASWEAVRLRLATAQGVEAFDVPPPRAIHRVLGWPDERGGWMPRACAMLAEGIDPGALRPSGHADEADLTAASTRWRLLLQLSADPELDFDWGDPRRRLYVWIDERDLAASDFSRIRAFLH